MNEHSILLVHGRHLLVALLNDPLARYLEMLGNTNRCFEAFSSITAANSKTFSD